MLAPVGDRLDERRRELARISHGGLRTLAASLLIVYLGWNAIWLVQGWIPPSLFLALTGLPSPTTGGVRSMTALAEGDWRASLEFNALAVPITLLFVYCVARLGWCAARRDRLVLPRWTLPAWIGVLSLAWVLKLAAG